MRTKFNFKLYILSFITILLFSFAPKNGVENVMLGKWKVSGMFCTESEQVPKGFYLAFLENGTGYIEQLEAKQIEKFTWKTNSDTLRINFENENGIKSAIFNSNNFLYSELPWRKKHIQLRYLNFKECGFELEFIK